MRIANWINPLLVAFGGACGAMLRYALSSAIDARRATSAEIRPNLFPVGTFTVNVVGSFVIGALWILVPWLWPWAAFFSLLLLTGFCGGFTTFSTATFEAVSLARQGRLQVAIASAVLTLLVCLLATAAGILLADWVIQKFLLASVS